MQTHITPSLLETDFGKEADRILRTCVHCGFCTATCPTYQELGDELDGPRGRIYQIKLVLEGTPPGREVQQHLDRCLTCLNCTTTCPSGVEYNHLIDMGREYVEAHVKRPLNERVMRWGLRQVLPYPKRFVPLLKLGQWVRPIVPKVLRDKMPELQPAQALPTPQTHHRKIIMPAGCVQPALTPSTDAAAIRVLDKLGIETIRPTTDGCCGAVSQHLAAPEQARQFMRHNIDSWWPHIEAGAEAIIMTASGCGLMLKDYAYHLRNDPNYAEKAQRVTHLYRDLCEVLTVDDMKKLTSHTAKKIAFHPPCTLQHGQKLKGKTEQLLKAAGFELLPVADAHSCCGSAGTYSILQADLSTRLKKKKLDALQTQQPALIATANVGCQTHLQSASKVDVVHWITLLDTDEL